MESNRSSGYFSDAFSPWGNQDSWPEFQATSEQAVVTDRPRSSRFEPTSVGVPFDAVREVGFDAVREEFQRNGVDSPYDPDAWADFNNNTGVRNMSPPATSWPAPGTSPNTLRQGRHYRRQSSGEDWMSSPDSQGRAEEVATYGITADQLRVLQSLPNEALDYLLSLMGEWRRLALEAARKPVEPVECRFCKKNGEEDAYWRSHRLRWRGKLVCPVLRRLVCSRCGAHGDAAHTLKYCPLASDEERLRSTSMMQSIRSRRAQLAPSRDVTSDYYVAASAPSALSDSASYRVHEPLAPQWQALIDRLINMPDYGR
ncbi:uncharacterized protein LOC112048945 [Bicyclus anynana]|uniref:Uncharacterized protein LOC112048945 n=1 Tax=Bicyclus anynana TaxID=110368 RepID=A0A6J1NBP6_BICAN|nr:uncharacterized protein LOC112048945 [Bicyclus anynana]